MKIGIEEVLHTCEWAAKCTISHEIVNGCSIKVYGCVSDSHQIQDIIFTFMKVRGVTSVDTDGLVVSIAPNGPTMGADEVPAHGSPISM